MLCKQKPWASLQGIIQTADSRSRTRLRKWQEQIKRHLEAISEDPPALGNTRSVRPEGIQEDKNSSCSPKPRGMSSDRSTGITLRASYTAYLKWLCIHNMGSGHTRIAHFYVQCDWIIEEPWMDSYRRHKRIYTAINIRGAYAFVSRFIKESVKWVVVKNSHGRHCTLWCYIYSPTCAIN